MPRRENYRIEETFNRDEAETPCQKKKRADKMSTIYVTGLGPGAADQMTIKARKVLEHCPVIIGYTVYIDLIRDQFPDKVFLSTPMRREADRCRMAFEEAEKGQDVAMVCSGDAGIYGMAGLICEIGKDYPETGIEVVPGITAASGGAAVLGAPLMHDFAVISLSDLLTPWELIEKRLERRGGGGVCHLSVQSFQQKTRGLSGESVRDHFAAPGAGDSLRHREKYRAGGRDL